MKDVIKEFDLLREASRHLRNTYLKPGDRESEEWFERIDRLLMEVLVLRPLLLSHPEFPGNLLKQQDLSAFFKIVPTSAQAIPVKISRSREHVGYWDHPVARLAGDEAEISFLQLFDWDQVGFRDMRYYLGLISASKKFPAIVGHRVLVECSFARVCFTHGETTGRAAINKAE